MKILPLITALLVAFGLYVLVFERDQFRALVASDSTAETPEAVAETETAPAVEDFRVVALASVARTIESAVVLRGLTEAARQVTVASETSGQVVSPPLRKGAFVNAGDDLCRLDPGTREASLAEAKARLTEAQSRVPDAEAALAEANARVREADINVNAARQLSQDGFASETRVISAEAVSEAASAGIQRANSALISARAGIEAAAAGVAVAEREIERLQISAPFAGLLETDTAELGSLMQPGTPCATIIQLDPIKLVGFVPEANVDKVEVGAPAQARLSTGDPVQGRVTFLSRSADDTTRTFRVEIEVENADLSIRDGQTVEIVVASEGRTAHLIPQSALTLDDEGRIGVRTIDADSKALFVPVTLLNDTVDGVWVTDLPDEVNIITVGQEFVIDGVAVNPTYSEAKG